RVSKRSDRRIDPQPRIGVPAQARALFRGARQTIGEADQQSVLTRFGRNHFDAFSAERFPGKALRRHAKRRAGIVEIQNLAIASPLLTHSRRARLAQPHAVPRAAPFEQESGAGIGQLVQIASYAGPPETAHGCEPWRTRHETDAGQSKPTR